MKLHALGVESEAPIIGYAPRLRAREAAFDPLSVALERKTVVTFLYLKPGEPAPRRRTVEPLALVQHLGRWHLHGIDRDVGQSRTFLLSRIVDAVTPTGSVFEPEGTDFATRALDELQAIWLANLAEVDVVPDTDAAARLGKRYGAPAPGQTRLAVHYSDINILADELAGYGPEVLVLSPDALREHVMNRLRATIAAHRDDESGSGGDDG